MVHVKRVELTNFKSFGGTTSIPLMPGFTVVSGPNGSGKSNILDALLFALGLSSSKGMRAERLPDLVNNSQSKRSTVETLVTVTFDLSDFEGEPLEADTNEAALEEPSEEPSEELVVTTDEVANITDGFTQNGNGFENPENPFAKLTETTSDVEAEQGKFKKGKRKLKEAATPNNPPPHLTMQPAVEWTISRKLRVTPQGAYTSTYYINGQPCTLAELHEQLNRLRIYPEGYNVVLQGDVTGVISMKPKERREIIDELAGVAQFDRKILLAKDKLDEVKDREERNRIVEKELIDQRDRLDKDRAKAEKYQQLRGEFQEKSVLGNVLKWRHLQQQEWQLREQIEAGDRSQTEFNEQLQALENKIRQATTELDELNARVKALGEEELIALQATQATQEAQRQQLQARHQEIETTLQQLIAQVQQFEQELTTHQHATADTENLITIQTQEKLSLQVSRDKTLVDLTQQREVSDTIASTAEAWVQQQTDLRRQLETLQQVIDPQRTEQARLRERVEQLERQIMEQEQTQQALESEIAARQTQVKKTVESREVAAKKAQSLTELVKNAEAELQLQQETKNRLLEEQRERQRKLDKLEAQQQAMRETSGTHATQVIQQAGLAGVCGLVAQLGQVEPRYQLALEIAAGARLGYLVVEDDEVASAGIELLKQRRAGRMTFLPLNKIRGSRVIVNETLKTAAGFIDYAVNLVACEPRYQDIFSYVFGNTVVFTALKEARRYLGQYRIVTLEGEILETSGAMTGGSASSRGSIHFGSSSEAIEYRVIASLQERLQEIERIIERCDSIITEAATIVKERSQESMEAKQTLREIELKVEQIDTETKTLVAQQEQLQSQISKNRQELGLAQERLHSLETELPALQTQLQDYRQALTQLEESHTHSEWQQMQVALRSLETLLQEREKALIAATQRLSELENQRHRCQEKIHSTQQRLEESRQQQLTLERQQTTLTQQLAAINEQITHTQAALVQVEARLGSEKQTRDAAEAQLRERHLAKQQLEWQLQKLLETQQERRHHLTELQEQRQTAQAELPDPLPSIPEHYQNKKLDAALHELENDLKSLQKRLQALEPVNMLALEEYNRTQERLQELTQKLTTLEGERTELLLRIENFTTLRRRSFQEAFDAVNQNFQVIFAELSDGDGYLELDNPQDPFSSGLNLVAHPKGKPVQRLASMSGGEKSLTALSFIFSLQRYRPSPFYAFDEVDMFLDGANVERLARMIKRQAEQAQFIVVSLRRPMMEASERTIGVTQARGAYTQVLGLKL